MTPRPPTMLDVLRVHGGIVQDPATAIAIVRAIALGLGSEEELENQQFVAEEDGQNWIVQTVVADGQVAKTPTIRAVFDRITGEFFELELPTVTVRRPPFLE